MKTMVGRGGELAIVERADEVPGHGQPLCEPVRPWWGWGCATV